MMSAEERSESVEYHDPAFRTGRPRGLIVAAAVGLGFWLLLLSGFIVGFSSLGLSVAAMSGVSWALLLTSVVGVAMWFAVVAGSNFARIACAGVHFLVFLGAVLTLLVSLKVHGFGGLLALPGRQLWVLCFGPAVIGMVSQTLAAYLMQRRPKYFSRGVHVGELVEALASTAEDPDLAREDAEWVLSALKNPDPTLLATLISSLRRSGVSEARMQHVMSLLPPDFCPAPASQEPAAEVADTRPCPRCLENFPSTLKFCGKCGAPMDSI
jgi:hypothetical protein